MDFFFVGNALLLLAAFSLQFGLFDSSSDHDGNDDGDTGNEPDPESPDNMIYDPAKYGAEIMGTEEDDVVDASRDLLAEAFFLGGGNDLLNATVRDDFAEGGAGDDTLNMKPGDDIAYGGDGNDSIDGGLGNDTLFGDAGDDWMTGNKDDDELHGGTGNDTLMGSRGDDTLFGDDGNDVLYGNTASNPGSTTDGNDVLMGGDGDDTLHLGAGDQGSGGEGSDSFMLYDPRGSDSIIKVDDFDPEEDVIGVIYTPADDPDTGEPVEPVLSVAASDDNTTGIVSLDGVEIAHIFGGQGLTAETIALIMGDG